MLETANKIYNRSYTNWGEGKINGRDTYSFSGNGCRMTVLKSTFIEDEKSFSRRNRNQLKPDIC